MLNANRLPAQRGFLLIEALVAILIFSVGVVALIGLQSLSLGNSLHGKYRADAGYLANGILAEMRADSANLGLYTDTTAPASRSVQRQEWDVEVASSLPNGSGSVAMNGAVVTVVVNWRNPDEAGSHNYTTVAQVVF